MGSAIPLTTSDERTIMRRLNFTDDMYEFIRNDDIGNVKTRCMDSFYAIGQSYKLVHGYIALLVCIFGTFANIFNLLILTRKEMRTPINRMLTALAFVDMLVMIEYVPFALGMYILGTASYFSSDWARFVLFHSHFTQILHTISIQLTLTMAIWRFVVIKFPTQSYVYCTLKRCYYTIGASFLVPILICIPNYLTFAIYHRHKFYFDHPFATIFKGEADNEQTLKWFCFLLDDDVGAITVDCIDAIKERDEFFVDLSDLAKANNGLLHGFHFWTFSVVVKLFPCLILSFFMGYLVKTLYKAKMRHQKLLQGNGQAHVQGKSQPLFVEPTATTKTVGKEPNENGNVNKMLLTSGKLPQNPQPNSPPISTSLSPEDKVKTSILPKLRKMSHLDSSRTTLKGGQSQRKGSRRGDRTSKMLLAVLVLFLITEFPQGIMAFLSGLYGQDFFRKCYNSFAEVWDILALINSAINFILYCFMSKQFRTEFSAVFKVDHCFQGGSKYPEVSVFRKKERLSSVV